MYDCWRALLCSFFFLFIFFFHFLNSFDFLYSSDIFRQMRRPRNTPWICPDINPTLAEHDMPGLKQAGHYTPVAINKMQHINWLLYNSVVQI